MAKSLPISEATAARLMAAHVSATSDVPAHARRRPIGAAIARAIAIALLVLAVLYAGGR